MPQPAKYMGTLGGGLSCVIPKGALERLRLDVLVMGVGEVFDIKTTSDEEVALIPLSGSSVVRAEDFECALARRDVFSDDASCAYLPPRTNASVIAQSRTEIAVCACSGVSMSERRPAFVSKGDIVKKSVGAKNWKRSVVDVLGQDFDAGALIIGETFNEPGSWSSFPPHKHDTILPGEEVRMEEFYLFRLNPPGGFGMQRVYDHKGLDCSFVVEDYDAITIPRGYHPVVAMPGHSLYYLWVLAGEGRVMRPNTDPAFRWLLDVKD